jgi:hypothetical protein
VARKLTAKEEATVEWAKPQRYPWDEWTNGSAWELTQGEDFNGGIPQFRQQIYQIAKRRGHEVQVIQKGTKLIVKFQSRVVPIRPADNGSAAGPESTK